MRRIIVASNNEKKIKEIKEILCNFNMEVLGLKEAGISIDIEENGMTFIENAVIKVKAIHEIDKEAMILGDDSGLSVEALGGSPGVYSARYAGEHGNDYKNNEKLLKELIGIKTEHRKAKFICAMALLIDQDKIIKVQGEIEGLIAAESKGQNGFGYDSLFFVPQYGKTFGELGSEIKNKISHRGVALKKLHCEISNLMSEV